MTHRKLISIIAATVTIALVVIACTAAIVTAQVRDTNATNKVVTQLQGQTLQFDSAGYLIVPGKCSDNPQRFKYIRGCTRIHYDPAGVP